MGVARRGKPQMPTARAGECWRPCSEGFVPVHKPQGDQPCGSDLSISAACSACWTADAGILYGNGSGGSPSGSSLVGFVRLRAARISSTIRPAFWRTDFSITAAICGLSFRNALDVLAALADPLAVVGEPGAGLFDDAGLDAKVDDLAQLGDALAVHDVELDLLNGGATLFLTTLTRSCCRRSRRANLTEPMRRMSRRTEA